MRPDRVLALVALLLSALVVTAPPPAAADPAPWAPAAKLARGDAQETSCPSATACWSLAGGELLFSGDGGASWTTQTALVPTEVDVLDGLDCPSVAGCVLTGRREDLSPVAVVLGQGTASVVPVAGVDWLPAVGCATATTCLATDGEHVVVTTDGGSTWTLRAKTLALYNVGGISCPGPKTCVVTGPQGGITSAVYRTTNLATSWTKQYSSAANSSLVDVACPSTTTCVAAGYAGFYPATWSTTDGGATWTGRTLTPRQGQLRSVACPSTTTCYAIGTEYSSPLGFATTDAGATWSPLTLPFTYTGTTGLACTSVQVCTAVGGRGLTLRTTDGWASYEPGSVPATLWSPGEMVCPSAQRCVATSHDDGLRPLSITSDDGGLTWTRHFLPTRSGTVSSLECPTTLACRAWSFSTFNGTTTSVFLRSEDGGATWTLDHSSAVRPLGSGTMGCPTTDACVVAGARKKGLVQVRSTTDGGLTWATMASPPGATSIQDVSCSTATACAFLGHTGSGSTAVSVVWTTADLGATYEQHALPGGAGAPYRGLDCAGAVCVAVGFDRALEGLVARSPNRGVTWNARPVPSGAHQTLEVSCGRSKACVATSNNGSQNADGGQLIGSTDGGTSWHVIDLPHPHQSWPDAVACPLTGTRCLAADRGPNGLPRILAGTA